MSADRLCVAGHEPCLCRCHRSALVSRGGCKSIADKLSEQCVKELLTHYTRVLLQKMKKGLSILCRDPQGGEEFSHSGPKLFVMVIDRCGMVQFGLWLGSLGSGQ